METNSEDILDDVFREEIPKESSLDKIGITLAKGSFFAGSFLFFFGLFFFEIFPGVLFIGMYYLFAVAIINALYFIFLIVRPASRKEKIGDWKTAGIMLLNIPVAIFYFFVIISNL